MSDIAVNYPSIQEKPWLFAVCVAVVFVVSLALSALARWRRSTSSIEKEFETKWRIGARTAVLIVRLTSRFRSEISLSAGEDTVNAKSV
jgi:hypothetical protein